MGKQVLKQQRFPASLQEPAAKLTQDRKVKAESLQLQSQRVFPIDPGSNCFGSLPIGKSFHKLQHRYQSQPPRRFGWLSPAWKEGSEQLILKDRAQFIAEPQTQATFGADGACQASCLFRNGGQGFGFEGHAGLLSAIGKDWFDVINGSLQFLTPVLNSPTGS
jgi:hypothetical protein